jgi:hypothetical protein
VDHSGVSNICECARHDADGKRLRSHVVDVVQWTIRVSLHDVSMPNTMLIENNCGRLLLWVANVVQWTIRV